MRRGWRGAQTERGRSKGGMAQGGMKAVGLCSAEKGRQGVEGTRVVECGRIE